MIDSSKVVHGLECCERTDGELCKNCPYTNSDICVEEMSKDALALLLELPQVIFCKDCKYIEESIVPFHDYWCRRLDMFCGGEWFCADGERKEDR